MLATTLTMTAALILVVVGLAGTLLPGLPGAPLLFAGLLLAAWAEGFAFVGAPALTILAALTMLTFVVEFVASALGARRYGASRKAIVGAALGAFAGLFFLPIGLFVGPFAGAVIGELLQQGDARRAGRAGFGATLGMLLGTVGNLLIAVSMIGVFTMARFAL